MSSFDEFFHSLTDHNPFPYQKRLATGAWPDALHIPTGLGKTAAVGVGWLWKRLQGADDTPRRLVYCLPMRVLVEQTSRVMRAWVEAARPFFEEAGASLPEVQVLMGGELEQDWREAPERPAILVGTQDMLLSRALMRGYGMSRYQWSVDYALLHNDVLWVYDEVQLMGPALPTSAQLDAFRRDSETAAASRSLWLSATLHPEWFETVDFAPYARRMISLGISDEDRERAGKRLEARKTLLRSSVRLEKTNVSDVKAYIDDLAEEVISRHRKGFQTLVILNRVDRAQALYGALRDRDQETPSLLLHARFREEERRQREEAIRDGEIPKEGRIVVATQAVEAGVDMTSAVLFTELAPWASMVQRFGRCNRYGEVPDGGTVVWIDLTLEGKDTLPYEQSDLDDARGVLTSGLSNVGPGSLPGVSAGRPLSPVLRRKDFLELFDTDPDLSGFDVDVAPYIRDQGSPQVQVFWRDIDERPGEDEPWPLRAELCPVSMGQIAAYLKKSIRGERRVAWIWDPLIERWSRKRAKERIVPGSVLLLPAQNGGYDPQVGFLSSSRQDVAPLEPATTDEPESYRDDRWGSGFVELSAHLKRVKLKAQELAGALVVDGEDAEAVGMAAAWHDVGKAHPAFQTAMLDAADGEGDRTNTLWAKSPGKGWPRYRIDGEERKLRRYFRHELASMLAWLAHAGDHPQRDLIAFLIAAHHGKVRMGLRALPTEPAPDDGRRLARGVRDGDVLPPFDVNGRAFSHTELHLDLMEMGRGPMGASWGERTGDLLDRRGPFMLAWLESLIRIADWRASAEEAEEEANDE